MDRLQVVEERIKVLTVTVVKATGVSVGLSDIFDKPDPYVKLRVLTSPNSKQRTSFKPNETNPIWNESFTFYLNSEKKNILELTMMDDDYGLDDKIGTETLELDGLPTDEEMYFQIQVKKETVLDIKLLIKYDETMELRFGHDLCDEEKHFLTKRKEEIFRKMSKVLRGNEMPDGVNEVPTIAIMGSGGGYRALCGLSGAFCALQESGILDCATYVTGLSGSSWYLSTLYSNEGWPSIKCEDIAQDLRKKFNTSILSHLHRKYLKKMKEKEKKGQPVTLTDFFGMVIGDALLDNHYSKLSHQTFKVKYGEVPLPICTGLRVQKDVSAEIFSEWVEFSPFEFGMAKYGVFGKTTDFGSKFYKGRLVKKYEESPLHFLQGIWGSAFSILLNRVIGGGSEKNSTKAARNLAKEKFFKEEIHREKTEEDDSEDEDEQEDEIKNENWLKQVLNPDNILNSRRGKAAEVLNLFRGLKFKGQKDDDVEVASPGKLKTICVVDSGIAFNSPYPTVIRTERGVDLILSFDFTQRDGGDNELPFGELLKAEQWAKAHNLPFPPIASNPVTKDSNIRECYVFENPEDPKCPTILHFVLINKTFKEYIKPGVHRETDEDTEFANFSIFDDPDKPYSTFKFQYDGRTFDRLHELMKFNTLLNVDLIKEKMAQQVQYRRNNPQMLLR